MGWDRGVGEKVAVDACHVGIDTQLCQSLKIGGKAYLSYKVGQVFIFT